MNTSKNGESNPTEKYGFNVKDSFQGKTPEEIKSELDLNRSSLVFCFVNIHGDFNLASGVRNSNWFNNQKVVIAGRKKWDRRGAVGTHNYIDVDYNPSVQDVIEQYKKDGYRIVAAEYPSTQELPDYKWDRKSLVLFGEEQAGLSEEVLEIVDDIVSIPGSGSVRSLNVSTTSGIFAYDYNLKIGFLE